MISWFRRYGTILVVFELVSGCASESVSVPISLSLDPFTCTSIAETEFALRCGGTLGVWIRESQNVSHTCLDIPQGDLGVPDIASLLQSADLGELPSDRPFSLELAVYSPGDAGACPDPLDDPTLPAYHGASALGRLGGDEPVLSVQLDCLEAAKRAGACREHVVTSGVIDLNTGQMIDDGSDYRVEFGRIAGEWQLPRFEPYIQLAFDGAEWRGDFFGVLEPEDDNCLATRVIDATSGERFLSCRGDAVDGDVSTVSGTLDSGTLQAIQALIPEAAPSGTYAVGIGRVVDPSGAPVAGAVLQPFGAITWYPSQAFNVLVQGIGTASHGYFVLIGSEPYWISGAPISVIASSEQGAGQSAAHVLMPGSVALFPVVVSPP